MSKSTILIVLEVEGAQEDAFAVIDLLLDTGFLQDEIAAMAHEERLGELRVTKALSCTPHQYLKGEIEHA